MSNVLTCTSTQCRYAQSGNWASTSNKNPMYVGNNSNGSYKYIGQWAMPGIDTSLGEIKKVTLHIYRNSNSASYARDQFVGCSTSSTDSGSVLSTGVQITIGAGEGWKSIDISGIAEYITGYSSTWYLLIGNPNKNSTYVEVAGYGSGRMLYLEIEFSSGSKIYLASIGALEPYQLYHAENGALVKYSVYRAESGALVKY